MGIPRSILGAGLLVLVAACTAHESDNVKVVTVTGTQSSGSAAGGGIIQVSGSALTVDGEAFLFGEPEVFSGRVPPTRLMAIGDALFRAGSDTEVVDALKTPRGTIALIRGTEGHLRLYHFAEESSAWSSAPRGARRILEGTRDPFSVRVLVDDDLAVRATPTGE